MVDAQVSKSIFVVLRKRQFSRLWTVVQLVRHRGPPGCSQAGALHYLGTPKIQNEGHIDILSTNIRVDTSSDHIAVARE